MLRILLVTGPGLNIEDTLSAEGSPFWDRTSVRGTPPPGVLLSPRGLFRPSVPCEPDGLEARVCRTGLTGRIVGFSPFASGLPVLTPAGCPRVRRLPQGTTLQPLFVIVTNIHPGPFCVGLGWGIVHVTKAISLTTTKTKNLLPDHEFPCVHGHGHGHGRGNTICHCEGGTQ